MSDDKSFLNKPLSQMSQEEYQKADEWIWANTPKADKQPGSDGVDESNLRSKIYPAICGFGIPEELYEFALNSIMNTIRPYLRRQPDAAGVEEIEEMLIPDNMVEAIISEHDINVPDNLLASPEGFGAHREAMKAAMQKILPQVLHIGGIYKRELEALRSTNSPDWNALREELAALEHQQWCTWAQSLMKSEKLSPERCDRWLGIMGNYSTLPEHVKDQDRAWADLVLAVVRKAL